MQLALAFSAERVEVGPVMVKIETTSGVGAGVMVVMVGVGVVELVEELEEEEVLKLVEEMKEEEVLEVEGVLEEEEVLELVEVLELEEVLKLEEVLELEKVLEMVEDLEEEDGLEVEEVLEEEGVLEEEEELEVEKEEEDGEMVVLTEVVVLNGTDSASWVGLLASWPWDLSDRVIEGPFEVEKIGTMRTLAGTPLPPVLVAKGTTTGVAVGLLVLEAVLTVEVLEDSGSESWVDLLATTVAEVVVGSIETLTRLPSLAVVKTTGVMVMPDRELEEVLTTEVGSSRVFSVVSVPSGPTSLVDVTGG